MSILQKRFLGLRVRTWLLSLFLFPLGAWGGLNLFFSTDWGTGILENKVEKKLGLPCEIGSVTWSPWAGVVVREVRILPPVDANLEHALLSIEEVQADVSWLSFVKGRKRWERLEVKRLEGEVSIEVLRLILARYEKPVVSEPVAVEPEAVEVTPPLVPDDPGKTKPETQAEPSQPSEAQNDHRAVVEGVPVDDFEGGVIFSDSSFRIYSEKEPLLSVVFGDLRGVFPVWGRARDGEVTVGNIVVGERFVEKEFTVPVRWQDLALSVEDHPLDLFGLDFRVSAAVVLKTGFPLGFEVNLPAQQLDLSTVFLGNRSPLEVASLSSKNRLQGYLAFPSSFRGSSDTAFEGFIFHDLTDGGDTRFDRGFAKVRLSSAGVVAEDIRLIGDDDAVLMNGFASTGGEIAATVRIVSSPERAQSHEQRVKAAGAGLTMDFQELITPDREFRDIRIEARSGELMMDLGEGRSWVSLGPVLKAILGRQNTELPKLP